MASGQKQYFFEQIDYYKREINRVETLYNKFHYKKKFYKDKFLESQLNSNNIINNYTRELNELRKLQHVDKNHIGVETDIDYYGYNKILMNIQKVMHNFYSNILI